MAVKEIISFVGYEADAGQPYQIIRLKEKIAEAEIAFPQTLTVNLAEKQNLKLCCKLADCRRLCKLNV